MNDYFYFPELKKFHSRKSLYRLARMKMNRVLYTRILLDAVNTKIEELKLSQKGKRNETHT